MRYARGWSPRMELFGGKVAGQQTIGLADGVVAAVETRAVPSATQATWVAAWVTWVPPAALLLPLVVEILIIFAGGCFLRRGLWSGLRVWTALQQMWFGASASSRPGQECRCRVSLPTIPQLQPAGQEGRGIEICAVYARSPSTPLHSPTGGEAPNPPGPMSTTRTAVLVPEVPSHEDETIDPSVAARRLKIE